MPEPTTVDGDRSTEAASDAVHRPVESSRSLRRGASLMALSGVGIVANGLAMLYRALFATGFEPGVGTLGGVTSAELAATNHELFHYVNHLHVNVAGLMVAVGIGVTALAWFGIRRGQRWAWATAVALPAVFLVHSLPIHRTADFSYDAVQHLGPGVAWFPLLIAGAALAYRGLRSVDRPSAR